MKICFVVNNYPPRMGGVESHVFSLARRLSAGGESISIITLSEGEPTVTDENGITVYRMPELVRVGDVLGIPRPGYSRWLRKTLRNIAPDVISVHTRFFPLSYLGIRASRARKVPVVHTEHGSGYVVSDSALISTASKFVDRTLGRYVLRHASRVLAVSEESAAFVGRLSGVEAEVFYNAIEVDPARIPADIRGAALAAGRKADLVFIGRMVAGKGWEDALTAFSLVDSNLIGRLHLVGDGQQLDLVRERVREAGLGDRVSVHGRVTPARVREILAGNIYINPTVLAEGFQTTLLEAVAEGGQIATYPVPGAHTLVEQGAPVVITGGTEATELAAAVTDLASAPRPAISRDGLGRWSWETRAREYRAICAQLSSPGHESRIITN